MPNSKNQEEDVVIPFADYSYADFWRAVKNGNEHVFDEDARNFLSLVVATAKERTVTLKKHSEMWRAQRSCAWSSCETPFAKCHPEKRMMPDPDFVSAGRANAAGKPVFYGSSDRDTAVKETRPWIGSLVSVARFKLKQEVTLINLVDAFQGRMGGFTFMMNQVHGSKRSAWV